MGDGLLNPIRLIGTGFLGKLHCYCIGAEEVFCGSEEKIIGANTCDKNEKVKTRLSGDGLGFPQFLFMIKLLGTFGSRQDLKNLKQVSQLYYKLLNPIYLDIVESVLSIRTPRWSRSVLDREIWMSGSKGKQSFSCGIPPRTWDPESAYIFRKIIVPYYSHDSSLFWHAQLDLQCDGIHLNSMISQIRPYITILQMSIISNQTQPSLLDFINQFPELKKLNIRFRGVRTTTESQLIDTLTTLKMLFQKLKKKTVDIKLGVSSHYWPILETFGNINGITIEINMRYMDDIRDPNNVRTFAILSDDSEKWRNIRFISLEFHLSVNSISSELMEITYRYFNLQDQIQNCELFFEGFPADHNPSEESTIQHCLIKLSQILSSLNLWKVNHWNVFCLNSCTIWQNLQYISICGLECPLEFLVGSSTSSSFPALVKLLILHIDQDVCIFHDSQKSHKEALVTYFGNLPKLKYLIISCKDGTIDRLSAEPELITLLKGLKPKLEVSVRSVPSSSAYLLPLNYKRSIHSY